MDRAEVKARNLVMWRGMLRVAAATAAFGLVHSALASRTAKRVAARTFGERNRNGLYRVFYIGQSLVTFGMLAAYIRRQPSREVYRVEGPFDLLMHFAQAGAVVYATSAAGQVGLRRITGLESFAAWLGDGPVQAEPEAQGPALDDEGRRHAAGPFAWSRHPLNFAPLPIFWLMPRMTTSLLAFKTAATIYLVIGSLHEETRLREAFGDDYDAYLDSGIPLLRPGPGTERPRTHQCRGEPGRRATMSRAPFDYTVDFKNTGFRQRPDLYRIGKGEQGVLLVEPYKSEILPHWRFKTVVEAKKSSARIYNMFLAYLRAEDFPGADMARKFLQMGWTRARRYANHRSGRKYDKKTGDVLPRTEDKEKAAAAAVFYKRYVAARQHPEYIRQTTLHQERYESQ
jgi:hypothetical protein